MAVGQEPRAEAGEGRLAAEADALLLADAEAEAEAEGEADAEADEDAEGEGEDAEPEGEGDAEADGADRVLAAAGPEADDLIRTPPMIAPPTSAVATTLIRTVRRLVLPRRVRRCRAALVLTW